MYTYNLGTNYRNSETKLFNEEKQIWEIANGSKKILTRNENGVQLIVGRKIDHTVSNFTSDSMIDLHRRLGHIVWKIEKISKIFALHKMQQINKNL